MPTALVTGPNSGIGLATVRRLSSEGYHIVAAGRSAERVGTVVDELSRASGSAEFLELDLASLDSVRRAAERFNDSGRSLEVLINNAGIGVNRRGRTEDGFEVHFGINHLGHFLLTNMLLPCLAEGARVIQVASSAHERADGIDLEGVQARTRITGYHEYAVSKLANILFIRELAEREPSINAYAVHPGLVDTPLIPWWVRGFLGRRMKTPEQGADTIVWCAMAPELSDRSGEYCARRAARAPSEPARDARLARELWERSLDWCGLDERPGR